MGTKKHQVAYTPTRIVAIVASILCVLQCATFFIQPLQYWWEHNFAWEAWHKWCHYFTIQSNLIVTVYMIWYWIKPNHKFVNGNFLPFMVSYITMTFALYSGLLMPEAIKSGEVAKWHWQDYTTNIIQHFLVPAIAMVFFWVYVGTCKKDFIHDNKNFLVALGLGMIYPTIYVIYTMFYPCMTGFQGYSVYGKFTNLWPSNKGADAPDGGSWSNLVVFFGAYIGFIALISIYRVSLFRKGK